MLPARLLPPQARERLEGGDKKCGRKKRGEASTVMPVVGRRGRVTDAAHRSIRQFTDARFSFADSMLTSKPLRSRYLSVSTSPVPASATP